jgi:hypothetical protein
MDRGHQLLSSLSGHVRINRTRDSVSLKDDFEFSEVLCIMNIVEGFATGLVMVKPFPIFGGLTQPTDNSLKISNMLTKSKL